jgi:4-amino-4-deoxy-L-arabinose transferase-like glycosyltransferase
MELSARSLPPIQSRLFLLSAALFVAALLLRLYGISQQNLWFDEHWTLRVASAPLTQLPELLRNYESSKPPLYFAFIHYWLGAGSGEFWLRLPSAIFGAWTCIVAVAIGRQLFGVRRGLALGCLLALSPFHIYYSQEARPYALWGLLMGLAFLFHLRFCDTPRNGFMVGYILFGELACYTFPYAFVIVGFSVLFSLAYRPALSKQRLLQITAANGMIILLYVPWLLRVMASASEGVGFQGTQRGTVSHAAAYSFFSLGLGSSFGPSMESLRLIGTGVFREAPTDGALLVLGFVLLMVLACFGLVSLWRSNRNAFYFAAFGMLVFWGTPAMLNLLNPYIPYNARYAFPALFFLMVLILAGGAAAMVEGGWKWGLVGLFVLGVSASLYNLFFNPEHARDDLRAAADFVRKLEPPPERLILCAGYLSDVFEYYYGRHVPLQTVMFMPNTSPEETLEPINQSLAKIQRFALIYSRPDHGDPQRVLPRALEARWRLADKRHWTGVDVYVFETARRVRNCDRFRGPFPYRRRGLLHRNAKPRCFPQFMPIQALEMHHFN